MNTPNLPAITGDTANALDHISEALMIPRDLLASREEIDTAWTSLPRFISRIPPAERTELHARMCVAVAAGLFDAAINYAWNSSIMKLRRRVRAFGVNVIPQLINKSFSEDDLVDLKDSELLELSLKLNLLSEEGFVLLDQCREVRNRFSAAHPPCGTIDDTEFLNFLNRCTKFALSDTSNAKGVDATVFIQAIKGGAFVEDQLTEWGNRLRETHDAQRQLLISTLHGIYCDPAATQESRNNCLALTAKVFQELSPASISDLINRHSDYTAVGDVPRQTASRAYFEKLGLLGSLAQPELHSIISGACNQLLQVHLGWNNFHNEPPFAQRLNELTRQVGVPASTQHEYVDIVCTCAVGNGYGISRGAAGFYGSMISNFSPAEVSIMFHHSNNPNSRFGRRVQSDADCQKCFAAIVQTLDPQAVPTSSQNIYRRWLGA